MLLNLLWANFVLHKTINTLQHNKKVGGKVNVRFSVERDDFHFVEKWWLAGG